MDVPKESIWVDEVVERNTCFSNIYRRYLSASIEPVMFFLKHLTYFQQMTRDVNGFNIHYRMLFLVILFIYKSPRLSRLYKEIPTTPMSVGDICLFNISKEM
ncbi:unnamed protein product [Acanthoscelides obtectus]|uniref:Uncharacterized protein n=1 Tax=Acanthoscelides obtectus TaxID=200917 RepID=A0A9P0JN25_ACAOB|nr:unnamed protein product [Acanthoscelides obtectus]CAK1639848.1 hypothetical protein AOBTE_LOCUS11410 [Acanthoscelides obtectus]